MRRRRDQHHTRSRVPQPSDHFGDLEAGKLSAFAGFRPLRDLDLDFFATAKIFSSHTKPPASDLLDNAVGIVAVFIRREPLAILAAFARYGFRADAVHCNRQRFMCFRRQRAKRHSRRDEPLADFGDRFDFINRYRLGREIEFEQIAQVNRRQFAHASSKLQIGRVAVIGDRALQQVHQSSRIGMLLAVLALFIKAADRQARNRAVERRLVPVLCVHIQRRIAFARNLVRHSGEEVVYQRPAKPDCFKIVAAPITRNDCDAHFGHDLEQAFIDRGPEVLCGLSETQCTKQSTSMAVGNRRFGQIGINRGRTDTDEHREIMRVKTFGGADVDRRIAAQSVAHQVGMNRSSSQHHCNADSVSANILVCQKQFRFARANSLDRFLTDPRNRGTQAFLAFADVIRAIDLRGEFSERRLKPQIFSCRQNRTVEYQNVAALVLLVENVGEVRKSRFQAHHMPFPQTVDWRIGDLTEILPEKLTDQPRLVTDHGKRRVITHRTNRFLAVFSHRRQDHLDIFECHASRNLALGQFGAGPIGQCFVCSGWQIGNGLEAFDQRTIILFGGDPVFQFMIAVQFALIQIDRDHFAGAKSTLLNNRRFRHHYHPGFGTDNQQIVAGQIIALRTKRIAINTRHSPVAIGHRKCGRAVPRLHYARHIFVHCAVLGGELVVRLPRFGNQHQLGRRRFLSRANQSFEHRIERCRVR